MSGLEGIVRPFQQPDRLTRKRIVATNTKLDINPVSLTWGEAGNLPEPQVGVNFTLKKEKQHVAIEVISKPVRIENPDDPTQYVMVSRPTSIKFKEKAAPTFATYPNTAGTSGAPAGQTKAVGDQFGGETVYPAKGWVNHPVTPTPGEEYIPITGVEGVPLPAGNTNGSFIPLPAGNTNGAFVPLQVEIREYILPQSQTGGS